MNYERIKQEIIDRAKLINRDCYTENHHIIPKSLGGTNHKSNLVRLTFREHLLIHKIEYKLAKDTNAKIKMGIALGRMIYCLNEDRVIKNSREFERLKTIDKDSKKLRNKMTCAGVRSQIVKISSQEIFEFWHDSFGYFKGTCYELTFKFSDLIQGELLKVAKEKRLATNGWCLYKNKGRIKEIKRRNVGLPHTRKEVYTFYHELYGEFIGTCFEMQERFIEQKVGSNICKLVDGKIKHCKGWRIK